jgi:hypothetical protein
LSGENIISSNSISSTSSDPSIELNVTGGAPGNNTLIANTFSNPDTSIHILDNGTDTRYNEWDRTTITTDSERHYNLLSITGSSSQALASFTQLSTGTVFELANSSGNVFTVANNGNVGIGTTSPTAKLTIDSQNLDGAGTAGINQFLTTANSVENALQYGNRYYLDVDGNTATTTIFGSMLRIRDNTTYGNVLRGLEVQTDLGVNTLGENTAISAYARTFGLRAITSADAGGLFEPAAGFFETEGTNQGNAIRALSDTVTTATLLALYHSSSTYEGTGLEMNFGNDVTGSFASSTSLFLDLQNKGVTVFSVTGSGTTTLEDLIVPTGTVQIGTTTDSTNALTVQGGVCITGGSSCPTVAAGALQVDTAGSNAGDDPGDVFDIAERYPASEVVEAAEIVAIDTATTATAMVKRADQGDTLLGIVSTKAAIAFSGGSLTLGPEREATSSAPLVALAGRVPVKVTGEAIAKGDAITISNLPGIGRKATSTDTQTVGIALEAWDPPPAGGETEVGKVLVFVHTAYTKLDTNISGGTIATIDGIEDSSYWSMQEATGKIKYIAPIDMNEFSITNVSAIRQAAGKWSLDENGLLVVKEVVTETITTDTLCFDDVCLTKNEVESLLQNAGVSPADVAGQAAVQMNIPDATSTFDDEDNGSTTTPIATSTPDTIPPTITLIGSSTMEIDEGSTYIELGASASDETDGDVTSNIIITGLPLDTSTPSTATITYEVSDSAGNVTQTVRTVTILPLPEPAPEMSTSTTASTGEVGTSTPSS